MKEVHVGEVGRAKVTMYDANGAVTDSYDKMTGISYSSTQPDQASVVDDDAEPKDATINFLAVTPDGTPGAIILCDFDGDPGDGVVSIQLASEEIRVVPGDAVAGTVEIELVQVPV